MTARFVILHHKVAGSEHWDLMLEHGGVLLTWQLARRPTSRSDLPVPARRIDDHRLAYLDYEGPISGGRGSVTRIDRGIVTIIEITATACIFEAEGSLLQGRYRLADGGDDGALDVADQGVPPDAAD